MICSSLYEHARKVEEKSDENYKRRFRQDVRFCAVHRGR